MCETFDQDCRFRKICGSPFILTPSIDPPLYTLDIYGSVHSFSDTHKSRSTLSIGPLLNPFFGYLQMQAHPFNWPTLECFLDTYKFTRTQSIGPLLYTLDNYKFRPTHSIGQPLYIWDINIKFRPTP